MAVGFSGVLEEMKQERRQNDTGGRLEAKVAQFKAYSGSDNGKELLLHHHHCTYMVMHKWLLSGSELLCARP